MGFSSPLARTAVDWSRATIFVQLIDAAELLAVCLARCLKGTGLALFPALRT
jgi:hypothetical protein